MRGHGDGARKAVSVGDNQNGDDLHGATYAQPVRALIFCEKWESGGVEAFVTTLLECMDRSRIKADLVACKVAPGPYDARLAAMGITPVALGSSIRELGRNLRAFKALLAQNPYDVVHLNVYEGMALAFARAAKDAGVPRVIVHSHNDSLRPSATRAAKLALHRAGRALWGSSADLRWAPSESAGRFLFGVRPFELLRNGIVPERFSFDPATRKQQRARLGASDGELVLGCVGRLCAQKNQPFLLDVFATLPASAHARLLLVGEDDGDGSYEAALRRRARELGLGDRVTLYGRTDDVAPLYQAMDVLCVPSAFEALGIVAVEAQAAGLPVVASAAVPAEARAGGKLARVALDVPQWVDAILSATARTGRREDGVFRVRAAGYDMRETAGVVARAYGGDQRPGEEDSFSETLVSVIVPVYNVAAYVGACLESICAQTHRNLEIIVVDDGSDDGSAALCDRIAATDARLVVIHQENGGLSIARNAGLDRAQGAYIAFVDSDDVVSPCFVEALLACDADIAQCAFTTDAEGLAPHVSRGCVHMSSREASRALQLDATGNATVVWNKLYRAALFEHLRFPAGRQHEDEFVTYRVLWEAETVAVTPAVLYRYRQRPGSIMGTGVTAKSLDALVALEQRGTFYRAQGDEELADLSDAVLCHRIGRVLAGVAAEPALDPRELAPWRTKRAALLKRLLSSPYLSAKKKAALIVRRLLPNL